MEATWVGCLVLVVAPKPLSAVVADAVVRAARTIADHPVYVDATRVSTSASPDPLSGDLGTIASTLYQDMVSWGTSREGNPAPRAAFCVLLVHTGQNEADDLVAALAGTTDLSGLPVSFRAAAVDADDAVGQTYRHIFDAADETLHKIEATPGFGIGTDELSLAGTPQPLRAHKDVDDAVTAEPVAGTALSVQHPTENPDDTSESRDGDAKVSLRSRLRETLAIRSREREGRRVVPTDRVALINDLSAHTAHLSLLYLVTVAEPTRPRKSVRKARTDLARDLTQALLRHDQNRWYVRAFTAGTRLHPGALLPGLDTLRDKDFPEPRSEYLDLFDVTGDVTDTLDLDASSFHRRDVRLARIVVLFLAGALPQLGEDTKPRLTALCESATVLWVHSTPGGADEADEEDFAAAGVAVVQSHEDILDELLRVVDQPRPTEEAEELPVVPTQE